MGPGELFPFPLLFETPCKDAIANFYIIKPGIVSLQEGCQDSSNPRYPLSNSRSVNYRGKV